MNDQHLPSAEHVGILAGISSVLLGWFGIHRSSQARVHSRLDHLAATKADKAEVDSIGDRLADRLEQLQASNDAAHQKIYDHLLTLRQDK